MGKQRRDFSQYEPKILLAFGEAVTGNYKIHKWLLDNGFAELAALASSLQADIPAFEWLLKSGYPQYAAFSNAIDDDKKALIWLSKHRFFILAAMVDAAWMRKNGVEFLKKNKMDIYLRVAMKIRKLKSDQKRDYDFYYRMHF